MDTALKRKYNCRLHDLKDLLLLDSCSTVNLITNKLYVHNIHKVNRRMHVRCNAGVRTTNTMGTLGKFPVPVWVDPPASANVLSLHTVQKFYHVHFDNHIRDGFTVTVPDGTKLEFNPIGHGLYALDGPRTNAWHLINMVADKKDLYTKRAYNAALQARKIQNIMMYPADRQLQDIASKNLLANLPIQANDVRVATDIFGSNIGALRGKTRTRNGPPVASGIAGVPPEIKQRHSQVTLCIDIMFINKIPFSSPQVVTSTSSLPNVFSVDKSQRLPRLSSMCSLFMPVVDSR